MKIQQVINDKLNQALSPSVLRVENESHMHNVPSNSETHFNVTIVSSVFENRRVVQRHQQVYGVLAEELAGPVHALALHTYTPKEWSDNPTVTPSPDCAGAKKVTN